MKIFGLTGKTGAGKSTVAERLQARGWYVVDTDQLARKVVEPGAKPLQALVDAFGQHILRADGTLDRKGLVRAVNKAENGVQMLNAITHPAIDVLAKQEIDAAQAAGYDRVLIDAAALLESPTRLRCEKIIVVTASEDVRLQRILQRDNLTEEAARQRMQMQRADDYYLAAADVVIRNDPSDDLDAQLQALEDSDGEA